MPRRLKPLKRSDFPEKKYPPALDGGWIFNIRPGPKGRIFPPDSGLPLRTGGTLPLRPYSTAVGSSLVGYSFAGTGICEGSFGLFGSSETVLTAGVASAA